MTMLYDCIPQSTLKSCPAVSDTEGTELCAILEAQLYVPLPSSSATQQVVILLCHGPVVGLQGDIC